MKGQTQVNPQETFDFTIPRREIAARPVSPQVTPKADIKRQNIIRFIESMQGLTKEVTKASEQANIERRKEGKAAQARGDVLPEDAHWAFLEGYELMAGASDAYNYEQELAQLLRTDHQSDVQTFNQKKDEISNKYLQGSTDAYIAGFMSRGMNVEANAEMKYQEGKHQQLQDDFMIKSNKLFKFDYYEHKKTGASIEENAEAGRELATELQALAVPYGLTKAQVSEGLVKSMGSHAAVNGTPEDMMFMFYPDAEGGTAMIDTALAPAINGYINSAISTRRSKATEARTEKARIEKEFAMTAGKAIITALDNNDPALAIKTLEQTGQYMSLDDYRSLTKAINVMREGSDTFFAAATDQFQFDNLRVAAKGGGLTLEALQTHEEALTRADYRTVFNDIVTKWEADIARSRNGGKKTPGEITMEKARNDGHTLVKQSNKIGEILNPLGSDRRAVYYTIHFDTIYRERAEGAGGATKMKAEDRQYVIDRTVYDSFVYEKPSGGEKMPPNPDGKVKDVRSETYDTETDNLEGDLGSL